MPAHSNPRRNRGIGPLLSGVGVGSARSDNLRISDADRQAVADRLAEHYGEGRLDQAEFNERVSQAMSAKTRGDLAGLFDDLPEPEPEPGPTGAPGVPDRRARRALRHRHHHHQLLTFALLAVIALVAVHAVHAIFWLTVPWLWLAIVAVVLLVATGHIGHSHTDHSHTDQSHTDHSRSDRDQGH